VVLIPLHHLSFLFILPLNYFILYSSWWWICIWCPLWDILCYCKQCFFCCRLGSWCCSILLHIMLFVVVLLTMVPLVERFLFLVLLALERPTGTMALLYHLNYNASYYAFRGGNSNEDLTCGIWMTFLRTGTSDIRWYIGAALSFIYTLYSSWRKL